jgi:hypothetical protein
LRSLNWRIIKILDVSRGYRHKLTGVKWQLEKAKWREEYDFQTKCLIQLEMVWENRLPFSDSTKQQISESCNKHRPWPFSN